MPWEGTGRRRRPDTGRSTCSPVENGPPRAHNTAAPLAAQQQPQQPRTSTPTNTTHAQPPAKGIASATHPCFTTTRAAPPRATFQHARIHPASLHAPAARWACILQRGAWGGMRQKPHADTHPVALGRGGATGRIGPVLSKCHRRGAANPRLRALLLPHTARVQTEPCGNAGDVTGAHQWKRAPTRSALRPFRTSHTSTPPRAGPPPSPRPPSSPRRDHNPQARSAPCHHQMWSQHVAVPNSVWIGVLGSPK